MQDAQNIFKIHSEYQPNDDQSQALDDNAPRPPKPILENPTLGKPNRE